MSIQICTIEKSLHISDLSRGKIDGFKATPPAEGFLLRYLGVSVMMNTRDSQDLKGALHP